MNKEREALKLALEALKQIDEAMPFPVAKLAQKAIKEALMSQSDGAQPAVAEQHKQEPVAWKLESGQAIWFERTDPESASALPPDVTMTPLYTTPPQRTWVRLTDDEIEKVWDSGVRAFPLLARQLEAKLKEKNT